MVHQVVLSVLSALVLVYMLLLSIRILLTWFQSGSYGKAWEILRGITDPYLNLFRGIKFLHIGLFDLTPIAAILVLWIVQSILASLSVFGTITLGVVLAIVISATWHSFLWLIIIMGIACLIRLIGLYSGASFTHPIWNALDTMVQPLTRLIERIVRRSLPYRHALLGVIITVLVIWIVGGWIIGRIVRLLSRFPI